MKLICWNVNGLRSIMSKGLEKFIRREQPDILVLQEIKISADNVADAVGTLDGLDGHYSFAEKRGYSGVASFIRRSCKHQPKTIKTGIRCPEYDCEGRFLISDHGPFKLYNVYIPSGTTGELRQNFKYRFLDRFLNHLRRIKKEDRERLVICGDFNICHREIDIHHPRTAEKRRLSGFLPEERAWMDAFVEAGFTDAFRHVHGDAAEAYTWWSFRAGARKKNLGWRLDYFFVGKKIVPLIKDARILPTVPGSDHCPITLELSL